MKYKYLSFVITDPVNKKIIGEVFKPYVSIMLSHGHEISKRSFNCLIDSGSDRNLFPAAIGELMHLKINKGEKKIIFGIGDSKMVAYTHQIKIYLGATNFFTEIDFAYEQTTPLLGRNGFFDHFKVVSFNEKEKFVELTN